MSLGLAESILEIALKKGADEGAVLVRRSEKCMLRFSNNTLDVVKSWISEEAEVYLGVEKKALVVSLSRLDRETIERSIERVLKSAKYVEPCEDYAPLPSGEYSYPEIPETFDPRVAELENPAELVEMAISAALEEGAQRTAGTLSYGVEYKALATSTGLGGEDRGTRIRISIRAFADRESSGHGVDVSRLLSKFDPERAGRDAGRYAKMATNPVEGEEGVYDAVLSPLVVANLLGDVAKIGASAFMVDAGISFLTGKLGERIASEILTVHDDGRLPNGPASTKFDDEGIPTRRTTIVERGVLKNYLHNTKTAKKFGVESTGNAGWIAPRPWNIVVEPGDYTLDEMVAEVDNGFLVTNNWYTRYQNYREGLFSTICRDALLKIERGEIVGASKGLRISEKMLRLLSGVEGLTKERRQVQWWDAEVPVVAPFMLVRSVNFTKARV